MAAKKTALVTIKPIKYETAIVRVVGDTPLIVHKWDEKMKRALPAGKGIEGNDITEKKEYPGPWESFINSMYWIKGKPAEYTEEAFYKAS